MIMKELFFLATEQDIDFPGPSFKVTKQKLIFKEDFSSVMSVRVFCLIRKVFFPNYAVVIKILYLPYISFLTEISRLTG